MDIFRLEHPRDETLNYFLYQLPDESDGKRETISLEGDAKYNHYD